MKSTKLFFTTLIFILISNLSFTDDYTDDAAEVDYYVPGILANDAMSQVNFLLCFMESINFSTFVNKGVYKALTDEAKCESASGADAASEAASATGSSASGGGAGAGANTVDATEYTTGIYTGVTSGNEVQGKGWVDIELEMGQNDTTVPTTAFLSTTVTADKSSTNRFGTFTMRYDLRNKQANLAIGLTSAGISINQGYLNVNNTTIQYRETGMQGPDRVIIADLANANNIQGFMQTILRIAGGGGMTTYAVRHQVQVNEGADRYCQKFSSANEYSQGGNGLWTEGSAISESNLATAITNAQNGGGFVDTDGGTAATITGEHCWDTRRSAAKRVVYEYGTYKNSDGSRADLTTPSMSLEANTTDNGSLSAPIWSHASYWGVHVNPTDRVNVTDSTVFKNKRNSSDNNSYNLRKNYYEIVKRTRQYLSLDQLGGVSFQFYAQNFRNDSTFLAKLGNLNFPNAGNCNAAQANCPEYSGTITVSGSTVTFTVTHGMDWGSGIMPFELDTSFSFTAANWSTHMTDSGWNRRMHFWDPDSHQSYTVPYAAFGDPDSTTPSSQVRTRTEERINIDQLATEISNTGDNATGLLCIRECLDASNMNSAIAAAFTAVENEDNPGALNVTPYKDVGDWWTATVYYDQNGNGDQDGGESDIAAGNYNNIGGVKVADAPQYTIVNVGGTNKLRDGTAGNTYIEYSGTNGPKVDARKHGDSLQNYRYYMKPASYGNNWTNNFGWAFHMRAVINSDANKAALYCDVSGGNARGYDVKFKAKSNDAAVHATGATSYYCDYKMWEGAVATMYDIRVRQMPDYRLYNDTSSQYVNVSPPQTVVFTVPSSGINYNFPNTNLAGKKFKLKFEGYGELHNIPGRVVDTCTGAILGKYVNGGWNQCYRYVHEFVIPDATVLTNASGGEDLKIRALRGDEYLLKLGSIPAGVSYSKSASDLPAASNIQNLFSGANSIGTVPATTLPSANSTDPSVIHGSTVIAPPN